MLVDDHEQIALQQNERDDARFEAMEQRLAALEAENALQRDVIEAVSKVLPCLDYFCLYITWLLNICVTCRFDPRLTEFQLNPRLNNTLRERQSLVSCPKR